MGQANQQTSQPESFDPTLATQLEAHEAEAEDSYAEHERLRRWAAEHGEDPLELTAEWRGELES